MRGLAAAAGVGVLIAHGAAFALAARACTGDSLRVDLSTGTATARASVRVLGHEPGVERTEWHVRYRGGFDRQVGVTRISGPRQQADRPPCGIRLHVGQIFLDDGDASAGTLAAFVREQLDRELLGTSAHGLGDFERATRVALRWSDEEGGSLRVDLALRFEDGTVPATISAVPRIEQGRLRWRTVTRAHVRLDRGFKSFLVGVLRLQDDIDEMATDVGDRHVREVAAGIDAALAAPPAIDLGNGRALRFAYCDDEPLRIVDRRVATVPLALIPLAVSGGPLHLARGGDTPALDGAVPLAFDFDLDAINAALHLLWASGDLDERIAAHGVIDWFNEAELVERLLSVRIEELTLSMAPTVERDRGPYSPFSIAAEARLVLVDGKRRTPARLFGRVGFELGSDDSGHLQPRLRLDDLALSCEPTPGVLEPCYGPVVDAARRQAPTLHGPVGEAVSREFDRILHGRRLGDDRAEFAVRAARVTMHPEGESGWIRVGLMGQIARRQP